MLVGLALLCATRLTAGEDKEDVINLAPKWEGRPDNFDRGYVEMGDGVLIVTNHGDLKGIRGGEPLPEGSARGGRQTKIPPASFESDSPSAPFFRAGVRLNSQLAIEASYLYPGDFTTTSSFRRQAGFFIPDFTEYPQTERARLHSFLFGPRIFLPLSQRWSFSASAGANILVNFSSLSYLAGARLKPEGFVDVVFHRGSTRLKVAPYANLALSYRWSPEVEFNLEYQFLNLSDRQDLQVSVLGLSATYSFGRSKESWIQPLHSKEAAQRHAWYPDRGVDFGLWGTYIYTKQVRSAYIGRNMSLHYLLDRYLGAQQTFCGGLDAKYFFWRYFGVGVESFCLDATRRTSTPRFNKFGISDERAIGAGLATLTLRVPLGDRASLLIALPA